MHKEAFIKMALRLRGMHGTHGAFKKLIPWFGGPNAGAKEVNPRAVYAATRRRGLQEGVEQYATGTAAKRGGTPTVLSLVMDTNKGWRPSAFNQNARKRVAGELGTSPSVKDMREYYDDIIEEGDWLKGQIRSAKGDKKKKLKQELGDIYRTLQRDIGAWMGPETKTFKPRIVTNP